jgi:hypothetical protein
MRNYRSVFWPAVLILVGVIALLANAGVISTDRLSLLIDMWPLILIVIGLELIARRGLQGATADLAAVLIVLIAAVGALAYTALAPNPGPGQPYDTKDTVGRLDHASLEVNAGAATITLTASNALEGDLYRAHIQYSGAKPEVSLDRSNGNLQISQASSFGAFGGRRFVLDILINSNLPWKLQTNSGSSNETYNLASARLGSIEISSGATHVDMTLGNPSGVVPISVTGGAATVHLHRPPGTGASVTVTGGAVSLDFDNKHARAVGTVLEATLLGPDMYKVDVSGGACTVTMDTAIARQTVPLS